MGNCGRLEGGQTMRIFIGGAHNGKRAYVKNLLEQQKLNMQWFDGVLPTSGTDAIVIAGIERWLAETELSERDAITQILESIAGRNVIFILTEIGRGIVPVDADQRKLRDACGRLYQQLFIEADEVTRIWYGIAQTIKKRGE